MKTIAQKPMGIAEIDVLAKDYAAKRAVLAERVDAYEAEAREIHRRKSPGIKAALAGAVDAKECLVNAIRLAPGLFVKPRTFTLHGVKLGFQKGKGSVSWGDDADVVAKIEKRMPEMADALIVVKKKPSADALRQLAAGELARLGVTVVDAGDEVFVKIAGGDVEKLVTKLLKEGAQESAE